MKWRPLGWYVHRLREQVDWREVHRQAREHGQTSPRDVATRAALAMWSEPELLGNPETLHVAAMALAFGSTLRVHELRGSVPATVAGTDLHSLPAEPPELLRGPCIVEVRDPGEEFLFGDTASLGCYQLEEAYHLVGFQYPDGSTCQPTRRAGGLRRRQRSWCGSRARQCRLPLH